MVLAMVNAAALLLPSVDELHVRRLRIDNEHATDGPAGTATAIMVGGAGRAVDVDERERRLRPGPAPRRRLRLRRRGRLVKPASEIKRSQIFVVQIVYGG